MYLINIHCIPIIFFTNAESWNIPITYQSLFSIKDFSLSNSMATALGVHMTKCRNIGFTLSCGGTLLVDWNNGCWAQAANSASVFFGFAEAGVSRGQPDCCREHVVKCILGLSLKDFLGELWRVYTHTRTPGLEETKTAQHSSGDGKSVGLRANCCEALRCRPEHKLRQKSILIHILLVWFAFNLFVQ